MKKLLWTLTLFGLTLLILPVNGIMEFEEMEWFTIFNGTKVFQTESDFYSEAKFPMVGLTLIQSAAAKGAGKNIFYNMIFSISFELYMLLATHFFKY